MNRSKKEKKKNKKKWKDSWRVVAAAPARSVYSNYYGARIIIILTFLRYIARYIIHLLLPILTCAPSSWLVTLFRGVFFGHRDRMSIRSFIKT